jgi:hypothetical protein
MPGKKIAILCGICLFATYVPHSRAGFHEGDKLDCIACHGVTAPDPSSMCLECHAQKFRVLSPAGDAYTPGGDFFWLTQSFLSGHYTSTGDSHGHNIIAASFGLEEDGARSAAPGDGEVKYQSAWLSCTSCHDPHMSRSKPGATYRLLGTKGYRGGGKAESISFQYPAPAAEPLAAKGDDWIAESDEHHPTYISGMSEWCTNCHSGYITGKGLSHPAGRLATLEEKAEVYNRNKPRTRVAGEGGSFDFLVPVEMGETFSRPIKKPRLDKATPVSRVMCLSCHRVHASAFRSIGRWGLQVDLLVNSPVLYTPYGMHAYYGVSIATRYGEKAGPLCFKCHSFD